MTQVARPGPLPLLAAATLAGTLLLLTLGGCATSPAEPPAPGASAAAGGHDRTGAPYAEDSATAVASPAPARGSLDASREGDDSPRGADFTGVRLLWVESRGVYCGAGCYGAGGRYRDLLDRYRDLGALIDILPAGAPLNAAALAGHAMVWIALPANWDTPFEPAEADAIEAFVAAGGGLELLADGVDTPNENLQPIADRFGISLGIDPADYYAFTTHSLFGHQMLITSGTGTVAGATPWAQDSYTDGIVGVLTEHGDGRVLVIGDANSFTGPSLRSPIGDNARISDNALFWLLRMQEMPAFLLWQ